MSEIDGAEEITSPTPDEVSQGQLEEALRPPQNRGDTWRCLSFTVPPPAEALSHIESQGWVPQPPPVPLGNAETG